MPVYLLIATFAIGSCAGFLNTIAGGGSLLALPFLIFLGLDASVANATNRVAILLQNIVATGRFRKRRVLCFREAAILAAPATMGAVCGTLLAVQLDEKFLKVLIALLITAMAVLLVAKPDMWESERENRWPKWLTMVIFCLLGPKHSSVESTQFEKFFGAPLETVSRHGISPWTPRSYNDLSSCFQQGFQILNPRGWDISAAETRENEALQTRFGRKACKGANTSTQ